MNELKQVWNDMRIRYQKRYVEYLNKYNNYKNMDDHGHAMECSYMLIDFFGLTPKEVEEVEMNGGFTNNDIDV